MKIKIKSLLLTCLLSVVSAVSSHGGGVTYAYLEPLSIIASSYDTIKSAMNAKNSGDTFSLQTLVIERQIVIKGERLTVMVVEPSADGYYTEVIIPSLGTNDHLWVYSYNLTPIR